MTFVSVYFAIRLINSVIHGAVLVYMQQKGEPAERTKQLSGILLVIKAITWGIGIVMLIDNLGYDVTTIIAGLGVGGIAIALAAQNILGDLFSYLVIFFDKPFEIGDFIIVGDNFGVVEKIGIKTSHVRSPDGQQLVMPNAEMVKSVIHNYKRLERRRVVFSLGVVYSTPADQLKKIPILMKEIVSTQKQASFDRAHLKSFGDFSVNFEVVYFIDSADFLIYMDTRHAVCLAIFETFEKEKIEFAFPTQTIFINNEKKSGGLLEK
jgi:small-conductance mechanosensitive channel